MPFLIQLQGKRVGLQTPSQILLDIILQLSGWLPVSPAGRVLVCTLQATCTHHLATEMGSL